jgi:hypothetical protein
VAVRHPKQERQRAFRGPMTHCRRTYLYALVALLLHVDPLRVLLLVLQRLGRPHVHRRPHVGQPRHVPRVLLRAPPVGHYAARRLPGGRLHGSRGGEERRTKNEKMKNSRGAAVGEREEEQKFRRGTGSFHRGSFHRSFHSFHDKKWSTRQRQKEEEVEKAPVPLGDSRFTA